MKPIVLNTDKLNSIPEDTNDMSEAIPVHPESQFNLRGRPETSALKAEVDGRYQRPDNAKEEIK